MPTEIGKLVYSYADQIFGLGKDLVEALEQRPSARPLRLVVGIDDVVPKEIAYRILKPAFTMKRPVRLLCREGTLERLVADLAIHDVDVVLSDAPITPSLNVRAHSHSLGTREVTWMATPALAKTLRRGFPKSLGCRARSAADGRYGHSSRARPVARQARRTPRHARRIRGLRDVARVRASRARLRAGALDPRGSVPARTGFARIGVATGVKAEFFAISVERRIKNPAVAVMAENARNAFR